VVDDEKLQNFTVDTQLQSKFATGEIDHILLTGVDFMRMRNDINAWFGYDGSVPLLDLYNPVYSDFDFGSKDPANSGPYQILNKQQQTGLYVQDQAQWNKVLVTLVTTGPIRTLLTASQAPLHHVMTTSSPGVAALTTCSITGLLLTSATANPSSRLPRPTHKGSHLPRRKVSSTKWA